jgi:hypothetical protein
MRWFLDYLGHLVVLVIALALAIALDLFKKQCVAWNLSQWFIDGTDDMARFIFRCDEFLICSVFALGTLVAIFDYVRKVLSRL